MQRAGLVAAKLAQWLGKRLRKHPVHRDAEGRSARSRAFALFDRGQRPSAVASTVRIPRGTAYRYFQQWKGQPRHLELKYRMLKAALSSRKVSPEEFAAALAETLGIAPGEVLRELEKPWGLKGLLSGKARKLQKRERLEGSLMRLAAAQELVRLYEAAHIPAETVLAQLEAIREATAGRAPGVG